MPFSSAGGLGAVVTVFLAPAVIAQIPTDVLVEEIVVTTQKREQSLRDVPVAVSAYGETFMDQLQVRDFRDLVDLTPGFNGRTKDGFVDALAMRGISTNDFGVGGDPSLPVFVDGVFEGRNGGAQTSFLDIERVEIVRGPQNTLFGRNAIAGAVSVVTNRPNEAFGGEVTGTVEEYDHYEAEGTINIPLTGEWFFRASGLLMSENGFLDNLAGGRDLGENESAALQAALRWVTGAFDATLTTFYESREGDPSQYWSTGPLNAAGKLDFAPATSPLDEQIVATDLGGDGRDDSDILRVNLNLEIDLADDYSLTSITAFKTYDFDYVEDYDATTGLIDNYVQSQEVDYISQELRLNSPAEGPLTWFVGASIYAEDVEAGFQNRYTEDDLCRALQITEAPDFDDSARVTGCDDPIFEDYWEEDIDPADPLVDKPETNITDGEYWGWAVYANATWAITDRLDLTVGARYTYDEKQFESQVLDSGGALFNNFEFEFYSCSGPDPDRLDFVSAAECVDGYTRVEDEDDWDGFTPRVAVNYELSDEWTLFANVAWGYKSGGFSTFGFTLPADPDDDGLVPAGTTPKKFDEEDTLSAEAGARARLFGNRLQASLSVYSYEYDDLQLTFFSAGSTLTSNVAEASGAGAELDLRWVPTESWDIFFSAAYSDTEIDRVDPFFLDEGGCDGCEGNDLWFAPDLSTAAVITYRLPVGPGAQWYFTAEHHYQDEMFAGPDNLELAKTDSWNEVNFRVGYDSGESWSIVFYVLNAFDEEYFERGWENADAANQFGYGIVNTLVWPSKPRTSGGQISFSF